MYRDNYEPRYEEKSKGGYYPVLDDRDCIDKKEYDEKDYDKKKDDCKDKKYHPKDEPCVVINIFCEKKEYDWRKKEDGYDEKEGKGKKDWGFKDPCVRVNFCEKPKKEYGE